jgi:hypothetical protein
VRPPESKAYVVLNDTEQQVFSGVLDAYSQLRIKSVLFSRRGEAVEELAV